jgi:coenzyme F420-reducing hydrogenase alpha subunit
MKIEAKLVIVALLVLPGINWAAESGQPDYAKIEQQLRQQAHDLQNIAKSMRDHARKTVPKGLNEKQKASLAAKRHDFEATADSALKLADQINNTANKARRRVLSRADMNSLGVATDAVALQIKQKWPERSTVKTPRGDPMKKPLNRSGSTEEDVRNERQMYATLYQNLDQKENQMRNMLATILKNIKETQGSVVRNLR